MTDAGRALRDYELRFFDLLVSEAPLLRYEELVHRARRDGADEATLDHVTTLKRLALEVRDLFGRRCQRRSELATLVDTARELACSPSLESALRLVVRRARLLVNMDMAFVSLLDDTDGDSYIAMAVGAAMALSDGHRLPWPGGLVKSLDKRKAVFWSADYLVDERIERIDAVDDMVRAEGLHAVLSVPMSFNDRHIGDLHVGHRQIHHFAPDEVALLRSLADLAAVAIGRTRLLDDTRADLTRAHQEISRARADLGALREASEVQSELLRLVIDGCGLEQLLARSARELGGALHLRDRAGGRLAAVGELPPPDDRELGRARLDSHAAGSPVRLTTGTWVVSLATQAEDLGCLLFHPDDMVDHDRVQLLPSVAQAVAILLTTRNNSVSQGQERDDFLEDLICPRPVPERIRERARRLSIELDCPHVIVVARPEGAEQSQSLERAVSMAHGLDGMKVMRDGCAVLLLPGDDPGARAREVSQELGALLGLPVTAGGAGPAHTAESVSHTYQEAVRCLDALTALGGTGRAACVRDLGFLGMLLADKHDAPGFIESIVGPVLGYDARRFTNLVETLETYFDSAGSRTRAAETLHVHPNTVSRRLERITQLLGPDWQRPDQALEVQIALRLQRVRDSLQPYC